MKTFSYTVCFGACVCGLVCVARADETSPATAVIDKAIKAQWGTRRVAPDGALICTIKTRLRNAKLDYTLSSKLTLQGIDHYRAESNGVYAEIHIRQVMVLSGEEGWSKNRDVVTELIDLSNLKSKVYRKAVSLMPWYLKTQGFKIGAAVDATIGGRPATAIKIIGPDEGEFRLFFDKQTDLLVQLTTSYEMGDRTEMQTTTFADYKDFGGIKMATRIETKYGDALIIEETLMDVTRVNTVSPSAFAKP